MSWMDRQPTARELERVRDTWPSWQRGSVFWWTRRRREAADARREDGYEYGLAVFEFVGDLANTIHFCVRGEGGEIARAGVVWEFHEDGVRFPPRPRDGSQSASERRR